jgi:hypothetical protein
MGALKIADHPLAEMGRMGRVYDWATGNHKRRLSLGRETLEKYKIFFDAVEAGNSNFPKLIEPTERLARELGLPVVYTSDSHSYGCMFSSWMSFPSLDFSSPEGLRGCLRDFLLNGTHFSFKSGRNRMGETLLHAGAVAYNLAREKIGWVGRESVEID